LASTRKPCRGLRHINKTLIVKDLLKTAASIIKDLLQTAASMTGVLAPAPHDTTLMDQCQSRHARPGADPASKVRGVISVIFGSQLS